MKRGFFSSLAANIKSRVEACNDASIYRAVTDGEVELVASMLAAGANPNARGAGANYRVCLMRRAVGVHSAPIVKLLLQYGADPHLATDTMFNLTPIMHAALYGDTDIIRLLLDAGMDPSAVSHDGEDALMSAAEHNHLDCMELLIRRGANIHGVKHARTCCTALALAAKGGHTEAVRMLLDAGADVNMDPMHGTALLIASAYGHLHTVKQLLRAGADVNATTQLGRTALMEAAQTGRTEIVKVLIAAGADINASLPDGGGCVLLAACISGRKEIVQLLLDAGIDVNQGRTEGATALAGAASTGELEATRLLIHAGADISCRDGGGSTPLIAAASEGHEAVVDLLLESGAAPDDVDFEGRNAACFAAWRICENRMSLLPGFAVTLAEDDSGCAERLVLGEMPFRRLFWKLLGACMQHWRASVGSAAAPYVPLPGAAKWLKSTPKQAPLASSKLRPGRQGQQSQPPTQASASASAPPAPPARSAAATDEVLFHVLQKGDVAKLQRVLAMGANANACHPHHGPALLWAIRHRSVPVMTALLAAGADANTRLADGTSLLMLAMCSNDLMLGPLLLAAGADPCAATAKGYRPIHVAAYYGLMHGVLVLKAFRADVHTPTPNGSTTLLLAAFTGLRVVVDLLIESGVDPNARNEAGLSPWCAAAGMGHEEVAQVLLTAGSRPTAADRRTVAEARKVRSGQPYNPELCLCLNSVEPPLDNSVLSLVFSEPSPAEQGGVPSAAPTQGGFPSVAPAQGGVPSAAPAQGGVPSAGPAPNGVPFAAPAQGHVPSAAPAHPTAPLGNASGHAPLNPSHQGTASHVSPAASAASHTPTDAPLGSDPTPGNGDRAASVQAVALGTPDAGVVSASSQASSQALGKHDALGSLSAQGASLDRSNPGPALTAAQALAASAPALPQGKQGAGTASAAGATPAAGTAELAGQGATAGAAELADRMAAALIEQEEAEKARAAAAAAAATARKAKRAAAKARKAERASEVVCGELSRAGGNAQPAEGAGSQVQAGNAENLVQAAVAGSQVQAPSPSPSPSPSTASAAAAAAVAAVAPRDAAPSGVSTAGKAKRAAAGDVTACNAKKAMRASGGEASGQQQDLHPMFDSTAVPSGWQGPQGTGAQAGAGFGAPGFIASLKLQQQQRQQVHALGRSGQAGPDATASGGQSVRGPNAGCGQPGRGASQVVATATQAARPGQPGAVQPAVARRAGSGSAAEVAPRTSFSAPGAVQVAVTGQVASALAAGAAPSGAPPALEGDAYAVVRLAAGSSADGRQLQGCTDGKAEALQKGAAPVGQAVLSSGQPVLSWEAQGEGPRRRPLHEEECCVVCMERRRTMLLLPCAHVVLCEECCEEVQAVHGQCPMCRQVIEDAIAFLL